MLEHGGNLQAAAEHYGIPIAEWLDLSTGINPHSYPLPNIPTEIWQRLPQEVDGLNKAAADYYGTRHLLVTAGSQAAIQALPALYPPSVVAIPSMMYAEHAKNWLAHGHKVMPLDSLLEGNLPTEIDILVLCNPNNPTATTLPAPTLLRWHRQLACKGGALIVDEAFMDTTPEQSLCSKAELQGLVVLRSLGKFFGLAGARVGFVMAEPKLLDALSEKLGPWAVAGPARYAAQLALQDTEWQANMRHKLLEDSLRLSHLLAKYGLQPAGSHALFQWVPTEQAITLHEHLAKHGIWVRLFSQWSALRFGLPPSNGWDKLESALAAFRG